MTERPGDPPNAAGGCIRFCILTRGRTGSRWLRGLLDSHPMVTCHGELFGENLSSLAAPGSDAWRLLEQERAADPVAFLRQRALQPQNGMAVGVKILYRQVMEQWPGLWEALREDRSIRVIHLLREHGIKRFISEQAIRFTGVHEVAAGAAAPEIAPMVVHVPSLLATLDAVAREVAQVRHAFGSHPLQELSYEELYGHPGPTLERVQRFLGLPPEALSATVRKLLPDDLRALIANADEVASALEGTPYAHMACDLR